MPGFKTLAERQQEKTGIKALIWGAPGMGKTSLALTLPADNTLFVDFEAGMEPLIRENWNGLSWDIRTWPDARDFACWVGGGNPDLEEDNPYSIQNYNRICNDYNTKFGIESFPKNIKNIFIDSISNASRFCFRWANSQDEVFLRDKSGKIRKKGSKKLKDIRSLYGLIGSELIEWIEQFQYLEHLNIWVLGGLIKNSENGNLEPLIDGNMAKNHIPFMFGEEMVLSSSVLHPSGQLVRALVCHEDNPMGFPAKTRFKKKNEKTPGVDMYMKPDLNNFLQTINIQ